MNRRLLLPKTEAVLLWRRTLAVSASSCNIQATKAITGRFKCSFGQTVTPNCLQPSATALQPHISLWRPRASVCLDQSHRLRCRRATDIIFTFLIKDIDQHALNLFYLTWTSVSFSHILPAWSQIKGVLIVTVSAHRHRPTQSTLSDNTHRPTNICDSVWRWNAGTAHSAFIKPVSLCGPAAPHDRSSMSKQKNPWILLRPWERINNSVEADHADRKREGAVVFFQPFSEHINKTGRNIFLLDAHMSNSLVFTCRTKPISAYRALIEGGKW